jgi:hypothetical protein
LEPGLRAASVVYPLDIVGWWHLLESVGARPESETESELNANRCQKNKMLVRTKEVDEVFGERGSGKKKKMGGNHLSEDYHRPGDKNNFPPNFF